MPGKDLRYIPGDFTDPKHRPASYDLLHPPKRESLESIRAKSSHQAHQSHTCHKHQSDCPRQQSVESGEHATNYAKNFRHPADRANPPTPVTLTKANFAQAAKCHRENLEHQPLPDTVAHRAYRRMQMQREENPGLALPEEHGVSGVAWKAAITGPTQCTKMRVYRSKTAAPNKQKAGFGRPSSSVGSFDLKWRFIKQKQVAPIDLAICWDMRPEDPLDEPKPTTHIDGSNGSAAPAVFQMVQSPKDPSPSARSRKASACDGIHGCGSVFSKLDNADVSVSPAALPPTEKRPLTSVENLPRGHNLENARRKSASTDSLYVNITRKPSKDSLKSENPCHTLTGTHQITAALKRHKFHKSSPNLSSCNSECSKKGRYCIACRELVPSVDFEVKPQKDYKMAFKAGVPRSHDSGSSTKSVVRVPKQREPYAKRNYDINSLSPPFSLWKGTACHSYPEHWRLASVYQHSYKPVETRKQNLLSSVYN